MRITVITPDTTPLDTADMALAVPVYEKDFLLESKVLEEVDELVLQALADKEIITGKVEECFYLPKPGGAYSGVLVLGLGPRPQCTAETLRRAAGAACGPLGKHRVAHVCLDLSQHPDLSAAAFAEGLILGQYDFDVYKEKPVGIAPRVCVTELTVIAPPEADLDAWREACTFAVVTCLSANAARHLANTAPNEMTPAALAEFASGIAREWGCECTVLDRDQMAALSMNALLGVAQGSAEPPRLIILRYHYRDDAKTVALVGKGVTFDTGGISLKPPENMHEMKYDMCGAAAVLCALMAIAQLRPRVNVVVVAPAVENQPDGAAQRPGDIVKAYNGKTIEVNNTDAEGRLVLADALAYTIAQYHPAAIVDVATLTGACVVALGHYAAGLLGDDSALLTSLERAGESSGERLWRLPLWPDYDKLIEGTHADLCNIGPKGEAGTIAGACFLKHFTAGTPWAHIDIAGTAWGGKHISYWDPKHATGFGVRLLTRWVLDQQEPTA